MQGPEVTRQALEFLGGLVWSNLQAAVLIAEPPQAAVAVRQEFMARLDPRIQVALVTRRDASPRDFLDEILRHFGVVLQPSDRTDRHRVLDQLLRHQHRLGRVMLLLVENLQAMSPAVLEEVARLAELSIDDLPAIKLLLIGPQSLAHVMESERMAHVVQRPAYHHLWTAGPAQSAGGRRAHLLRAPAEAADGAETPGTASADAEWLTVALIRQRVLIGRGETADIQVDSVFVSRYHALIVHEAPLDIVLDLGSTNGIQVNGSRTARHILRDGDVLQVGPSRFIYRNGDARDPPFDPAQTLYSDQATSANEGAADGDVQADVHSPADADPPQDPASNLPL